MLSATRQSRRNANGIALNDIGHQGLMHDEEFQVAVGSLIYNRARTLHIGIGRFMQRDPLGAIDGPSLYEYLISRVTAFADPSGLAIIPYDPWEPTSPFDPSGEIPLPPLFPGPGSPPREPGDRFPPWEPGKDFNPGIGDLPGFRDIFTPNPDLNPHWRSRRTTDTASSTATCPTACCGEEKEVCKFSVSVCYLKVGNEKRDIRIEFKKEGSTHCGAQIHEPLPGTFVDLDGTRITGENFKDYRRGQDGVPPGYGVQGTDLGLNWPKAKNLSYHIIMKTECGCETSGGFIDEPSIPVGSSSGQLEIKG